MSGSLNFEMEGHVWVVERDENDNEISREEIEGDVVLRILITILEESLKALELDKKEDDNNES